MLVSVIIPATNYDKFLEAAVDSALRDGWHRIEVIVVLDGENQAAPPWLKRKGVRLACTGQRAGSATAINLGIKESRGEYVARLDADDISLPGRFEKQITFLEEHRDVVLVGALAVLIDHKGIQIGPYGRPSFCNPRQALLRHNPFIHSSFFCRRQQIIDIGLYDESCSRMQDYEILLRLAHIGKLAIIEETLIHYRVHGSQNSKNMTGFFQLMMKLSKRKRHLAKLLGQPTGRQLVYDVIFAFAQYLRYLGLRTPRYLKNAR